MDLEESAVNLIVNAAESRSACLMALQEARKGNMEGARAKLKEAHEYSIKAHEIQTQLIQNEMAGKKMEYALLMVHAQDHVMNAILLKELVEELLFLYEK